MVLELTGQVLSKCWLLGATGLRILRDLYHSFLFAERNPTHSVSTLSDQWLNGYPYLCTLVILVSTFKWLATECYRYTDTSRPIPFNSPCREESNETLPDSGGQLPANVSAFFSLLTCIAMWTLQNQYHSITLAERNPTHSVLTLTDHWLKGYPFFCTLVSRASTFKLLATGCYRHVDTSRPIPFNFPLRVDSHETLPDSCGHLPAQVSAIFSLLTTIAMWTLRDIYHSIPLAEGNPTHSAWTLSDQWFKGYQYLCTLVLRASTFKWLATECYGFLDSL